MVEPGGPARWLTKPWVWLLIVGLGFAFPLIKALRAELPPPLPGVERRAEESALPDDTGARRSLAELQGRIVVVTALTLANAVERDAAFDGLRRLRKRLRGLGREVAWFTICSGGDAPGLAALLDEKKARRPTELYVLDASGREFERLATAAGSASAAFLLLDRHARVRGSYGDGQDELDRLVEHAGQLANWAAQDPPPGAP